MEKHHTHARPENLDAIWEHLGDTDRHVRFAARTALEHLNPEIWQQRAVAETEPQTLINATIALARRGDKQFWARS